MLNRRHIRIKVMQIIYAFKVNENNDLKKDKQFLLQSIENMYNLYLLILSLLVEIQGQAEVYLIKSKQKHLATSEEKSPNKKFINNTVLSHLKNNNLFQLELENRKINNWSLDNEYVDILFKELLESELYKNYMLNTTTTFQDDKTFLIEFFKTIIAPNNKLYDYFEDKNITWLDDLPVVNTTIVKLLRKLKQNSAENHFLPKLFKDKDDKNFAIQLLKETVLNADSFSEEIAVKTTNWDNDRIARIDFILLQMAICEFQKFSSIPIKVTINEYLEIAKEYSTPKSSIFINGILDKIVKEYKDKGTLNKVGRGLL